MCGHFDRDPAKSQGASVGLSPTHAEVLNRYDARGSAYCTGSRFFPLLFQESCRAESSGKNARRVTTAFSAPLDHGRQSRQSRGARSWAEESGYQDEVAGGRYAGASEVVRAGSRLLEHDEERLCALRAAIDEGLASPVVDGDPFARLRAKYGLEPRVG